MIKERLIDLDRDQLDLLHTILKRHIPDKIVWAYGSRVTWKAGETSDLDLAVFDCDSMKIHDLKEALEESDLLISVDVMDWESIPDDFKKNIRGKYVVLQEKSSKPTGWRQVMLKDVAEVNPKERIPKNTKAPKVLMDFLVPHTKQIPKQVNATYKGGSKFRNGDTLLARITPCLENGKTGFVDFLKQDQVGFGSTEFIVIREKQDVTDRHYLYYLAVSDDFREMAVKSMTGTSGRQRVVTDEILRYKFLLPSLPEQKAIAEVLSSLDDKIDLLHCQNKTLEDMTELVFRVLFKKRVDGRWEKRPLSHFGDVICGKTPSKKLKDYFRGNTPFIKIPDMHGRTFVFDTNDTLTESGKSSQSNKTLPPKSICVSCIATVGLVSMNAFESQTNQQINSIVPVKDEYRYYLYLFMKSSKNLLEAMASGGTATMNLNTGNFAKIMVPVANEKLMSKFDSYVKPLFEKIFFNQSQIRALENLRDALLAKLMSGNIRVNCH